MKHVTPASLHDPIRPETRKQFVLAELRYAQRRAQTLVAELELIGISLRDDIITSDTALDWAEENAPGCLGYIPACVRIVPEAR